MSEILSTSVCTEDVPGTPKVSRALHRHPSESGQRGAVRFVIVYLQRGKVKFVTFDVAGLFDLCLKWRWSCTATPVHSVLRPCPSLPVPPWKHSTSHHSPLLGPPQVTMDSDTSVAVESLLQISRAYPTSPSPSGSSAGSASSPGGAVSPPPSPTDSLYTDSEDERLAATTCKVRSRCEYHHTPLPFS